MDLAGDAASFPARVASPRMAALMQRMLARRLSPDLLASYMGSSAEMSDMDKRAPDYQQS